MATMDGDDITAIDPKQIRAQITIDAPTQLQIRDVRLVLQFEFYGNAGSEYEFQLKLANQQTVQQKKSWYSAEVERFQYELELEDASVAEFKKYQRDFYKYGKPRKYHWTVYYSLLNRPPKGDLVEMDLELKLSDNDDYFYLLEGASVD